MAAATGVPTPSVRAYPIDFIYQEDASDRTSLGPNAGRKALTLQTVPASDRHAKLNELVSECCG